MSINTVKVNNHSFTWALVSRRAVHRAGTRFFSRGIDKDVRFFLTRNSIKKRFCEQINMTTLFSGLLFEFC